MTKKMTRETMFELAANELSPIHTVSIAKRQKAAVAQFADAVFGKKLDCGIRSGDWTDHIGHTTPKCSTAMRKFLDSWKM